MGVDLRHRQPVEVISTATFPEMVKHPNPNPQSWRQSWFFFSPSWATWGLQMPLISNARIASQRSPNKHSTSANSSSRCCQCDLSMCFLNAPGEPLPVFLSSMSRYVESNVSVGNFLHYHWMHESPAWGRLCRKDSRLDPGKPAPKLNSEAAVTVSKPHGWAWVVPIFCSKERTSLLQASCQIHVFHSFMFALS